MATTQKWGCYIATLIKNARILYGREFYDVRMDDGVVAAIGDGLSRERSDLVVDAEGGTLLPGLQDHHMHMMAFAAALDSLRCGPPQVGSANELASMLRARNASKASGWVRGIAYHSSVAGDIDRYWLDRHIPDRPVRIQHRGGRLWVLNSAALRVLDPASGDTPPGLERKDGEFSGRLFDGDQWLRSRLHGQFPSLAKASRTLAGYGITGITDTTPTNGTGEWTYFEQSQQRGQLLQRVRMMGSQAIAGCGKTSMLQGGEFKIHLLESRLPAFDELCLDIGASHARNRGVAIHCVTLAELVFALGALRETGVRGEDRIEHASVTPPDLLQSIAELGIRVVTQPHFIAERGDDYLAEVDTVEQPWLYRCAAFIAAGIPLAAGSDAPFGQADPWYAMQAAVERKTRSGIVMEASEALTPEQALTLYLSRAETPGTPCARFKVGAPADLCLLGSPWEAVRRDLSSRHVRVTWLAGKPIYGSV